MYDDERKTLDGLSGKFNQRDYTIIGTTVVGGVTASVLAMPAIGGLAPLLAAPIGAAIANFAVRSLFPPA